jgi:oligo-1,6-glucosidase
MQWDASPNAGFCGKDIKPWMRVNDDYLRINAAVQLNNPQSVFSYWKLCLEFRREHKDVFVYGGFEILDATNKDVVAFRRFSDSESWVTVTNFTGKHLEWAGLANIKVKEWVLGNYPLDVHNSGSGFTVTLRPWEGIIGECLPV